LIDYIIAMPFGKSGTVVTISPVPAKAKPKSTMPIYEDFTKYKIHGQEALDIDEINIRFDLIKKMVFKDPILIRCILMKVTHALANGYAVRKSKDTSTAELHAEAFDNWCRGKHIKKLHQREPIEWTLETAAFQYIMTGQIFMNILPDRLGFPVKLIVLDSEDIRINYDEHGKLKEKWVDGKLEKGAYTQVIDGQEVAQFAADEIIHIRYNRLANRMFGMPITQSLLEAGAAKRLAFLFNAKFFENHKPRGLWQLGEVPPSIHKAFEELLKNYADTPQVDLVMSGKGTQKYQALTTNEEMQFAELYKELIAELVFALGIPAEKVLFGGNRAVLDGKNPDYERGIQKLQRDLNIMMTEIAKMFGWHDIEFVLRPISKADEVRETQMAVQLWTSEGITLNQFLDRLNMDVVTGKRGKMRRTELLHDMGGKVKTDVNMPQIANNPANLPEVNPNVRENKALKERKK